jgi:hypothetical protein
LIGNLVVQNAGRKVAVIEPDLGIFVRDLSAKCAEELREKPLLPDSPNGFGQIYVPAGETFEINHDQYLVLGCDPGGLNLPR